MKVGLISTICGLAFLGTCSPLFANTSRGLTLEDLFAGHARFQEVSSGQKLTARFGDPNVTTYDGKWNVIEIPINTLPSRVRYLAFIRGIYKNPYFDGQNSSNTLTEKWNVFLMQSWDGVNFEQVGDAVFASLKKDWSIYDPHIAIDTSVSPARYIMTTECISYGGSHSTCLSESRTPWINSSWSNPVVVVKGQTKPRYVSASTGVTLAENGRLYLKWTQVDDGFRGAMHPTEPAPDEGNESTSSWAAPVPALGSFLGVAGHVGVNILPADPNVYCNPSTNGWDCNQRDLQDWKKIGSQYYAIYNGGNYYRCIRPSSDRNAGHKSQWGLAFRRSGHPLGTYNESASQVLYAERDDTCGIGYPYVTELDGETYLYFSMFPRAGGSESRRVKLVRTTSGQPSVVARMTAFPRNHHLNLSVGSEFVRERIRSLYIDVLGINPEWWHIEDWMRALRSEADFDTFLARSFINISISQGRLTNMNSWQQAWVLYKAILMREPDSEGLAHHAGQLSNGVPLNQMMEGFFASTEYRTRIMYRQVLGRENTDSQAHTTIFSYLENGGDAALVKKPMALSLEGRALIQQIYGEVLSRHPTEGEVQYAADLLANGLSYMRLRSWILETHSEIWNPLSLFWPSIGPGSIYNNFPGNVFHQNRMGNVSTNILYEGLQAISATRTTQGQLDPISRQEDNSVVVPGWACLQEHPGVIRYRLLVNGKSIWDGVTNIANEPAVSSACGTGQGMKHRFLITIPELKVRRMAGASSMLQVQHPMTGTWRSLNTQTIPQISTAAFGTVSATRTADGSILATGWGCIPGRNAAVWVRLVSSGVTLRSIASALPVEQSVLQRCGIAGNPPLRYSVTIAPASARTLDPKSIRLEVMHHLSKTWVPTRP